MLLRENCDRKLGKGVISKVTNFFSISIRSAYRIWREAKYPTTNYDAHDFPSSLVKRVGHKKVQINLERVKDVPLWRRTNIRSLSKELEAKKSTVHRRIKEGSIRPYSNAVKPYLSDANKKARVEFCLSMIDQGTIMSQPTFVNMHDRIHINEKWFYMSKTSQKYYLHPEESVSYRTCKSKRFIVKIMFLTAVARPCFDVISNRYFDGEIRKWPFVYNEPAKRNSKNRIAGTMELKPILSITKDVIRSCFLKKLLPSIKEKWPASGGKTIYIQQDNARPHIDVNDPDFVEAGSQDGFDIRLSCQPANSLDMNVLDLSFFRAIDSLQHQQAPNTIEEFVLALQMAFDMFPIEDLNNVFFTLQSCMVEVMRNFGGNNYKIPHMGKQKLIKNGQLPESVECDFQVFNQVKEDLSNQQ